MTDHAVAPVRAWDGNEWIPTYDPVRYRTDGLIAHWSLNDAHTDGSTALEGAGSENHAVIGTEGTVTTGIDSPTGEGYYFQDPNDGYNHDDITFADGETHTFAVWVRIQDDITRYLLPFGDTGSGSRTIYFSTNGGVSDPTFRYRSGTENNIVTEGMTWLDGDWHHAAWRSRIDDSGQKWVDVFTDGQFIAEASYSDISMTYNNIGIGYSNNEYNWVGDLSNIRIYDRTLTDGEINGIYARGAENLS